MVTNMDGFLYPEVDSAACTECKLCEKVCPALNDGTNATGPLLAYAAKSLDYETRISSSSGGIFTELSKRIISIDKGIVFGARYSADWSVMHNYADNLEGIECFRGSKYVQSDINDCFRLAERFLKEGKRVLFSGTPCQIKALKLFLSRDYDNLTTVDVVCHGAPSPLVWQQYLSEFKDDISNINFRDKTKGWKQFCLRISGKNGKNISVKSLDKDPFMFLFLKDLCLRPSCYDCPAKGGDKHSGSDITLGDFWGIQTVMPEMDDDKGTSLVIANTSRGVALLSDLNIDYKEVSLESARKNNSAITKSIRKTEYVELFWKRFHSRKYRTTASLVKSFRVPLYKRIIVKLHTSISRH